MLVRSAHRDISTPFDGPRLALRDLAEVPIGRAHPSRMRLFRTVDRVTASHERISVTRHGHHEAVVIAAGDLDALEDTLDILSDPVAVREIAEARKAVARGRAWISLRSGGATWAMTAEYGLLVTPPAQPAMDRLPGRRRDR